MKILFLILLLSISVSAQTQPSLDDQVKPIVASFKGKVSLFAKNLDTMWSVDNPAYLLMSRLSEVLAEGLARK